ncbi:glycosyltransferase family protein [Nocardioides sp. B-3]|uniref:glycosyltransferase family protein n=1 Tax=Nocardioides sp. B-3 TaxID=2895565 RepID=UPI0021522172|nr:glycosyltransferase [Nocardioides sp. B-3]UUZ61046.1 glycosyltransferase [Nocardioides sp. B-3]
MLSQFLPEQLMELCLVQGDLEPRVRSMTLPSSVTPLRHVSRRFLGGAAVARSVNASVLAGELAGDTDRVSARNRVREIGNAYLDMGPVRLPKDAVRAAREFAPHVVYTSGCTIGINRLALAFARACRVPVLVHYLDDWRASLYTGRGTRLPRRALLRSVARLEAGAAVGPVISDLMAAEYTRRTGLNYLPLMNAVDTTRTPTTPPSTGTVRVVYTGGLHLHRQRALLDVEAAIRGAGGASLTIHTGLTSRWAEPLFDPAITTFAPYVPHDQIHGVYADADVLVHAESADPDIAAFIRYSISTKISEYLAAGRPILCYAPAETALHQYVAGSGAGIAVSTAAEVSTAVRALVADPALRAEMGVRGVELARAGHSGAQAHETLVRAIRVLVDDIPPLG